MSENPKDAGQGLELYPGMTEAANVAGGSPEPAAQYRSLLILGFFLIVMAGVLGMVAIDTAQAEGGGTGNPEAAGFLAALTTPVGITGALLLAAGLILPVIIGGGHATRPVAASGTAPDAHGPSGDVAGPSV